jgi:uncharacterized heparinase superfamily protein
MAASVRNLLNYFHTIRYLRPIQVIGRLKRYFKYNKINNNPAGVIRARKGSWKTPARRSQRLFKENVFRFLNETHQINEAEDWNNPNLEKLWLYNLHYFDDLTSVNAIDRSNLHDSLINKWIENNPFGVGNGWEPYTISLRTVNWIKWHISGNDLNDNQIHSLTVQIRFLSKNIETHLMGNHLLANAKALIFSGLFFSGSEASEWYKTGCKIFATEISEQTLSDGGNFELSPMYHSIILEDFLDILNLHRLFEYPPPNSIEVVINKMLTWLSAMCHPDNEISFFNDAALDNTPSTNELFRYSDQLGFVNPKNTRGITDLEASGYSRVSLQNAVAIIDRAAVGPRYIPGHAHADTLSFELSIFGHRVIVNSGTSLYGIGVERLRQRGTSSHATVMIDNQDSSEVWGGFRVARRAKIFEVKTSNDNGNIYLSAKHDGYKRLSGSPVHCRSWVFKKNIIEVIDDISGKGIHDVKVIFPLHPSIQLIGIKKNQVDIGIFENKIKILFEGDGKLIIKKSTYHPEFGVTVPSNKLVYHLIGKLPVKITTRINW